MKQPRGEPWRLNACTTARPHTARVVAARSALVDYPFAITTGGEHVAALSDALSEFDRTVRVGMEGMNELEDADSADVLTEISRGIDQWLWFVEAHTQG